MRIGYWSSDVCSSDLPDGAEWDRFAGLDADPEALQAFLDSVPFAARLSRRHDAPQVQVPDSFDLKPAEKAATQHAFGQILNDLGKGDGELAKAIVTTSPDVTVSTNQIGRAHV